MMDKIKYWQIEQGEKNFNYNFSIHYINNNNWQYSLHLGKFNNAITYKNINYLMNTTTDGIRHSQFEFNFIELDILKNIIKLNKM